MSNEKTELGFNIEKHGSTEYIFFAYVKKYQEKHKIALAIRTSFKKWEKPASLILLI